METERLYQCGGCGQIWSLRRVSVLNTTTLLHSPCCCHSMREVKSSFASLDAPCLAETRAPRPLLELLYQEWRLGGRWEPRKYARFIDYVRHVLAHVRELIS